VHHAHGSHTCAPYLRIPLHACARVVTRYGSAPCFAHCLRVPACYTAAALRTVTRFHLAHTFSCRLRYAAFCLLLVAYHHPSARGHSSPAAAARLDRTPSAWLRSTFGLDSPHRSCCVGSAFYAFVHAHLCRSPSPFAALRSSPLFHCPHLIHTRSRVAFPLPTTFSPSFALHHCTSHHLHMLPHLLVTGHHCWGTCICSFLILLLIPRPLHTDGQALMVHTPHRKITPSSLLCIHLHCARTRVRHRCCAVFVTLFACYSSLFSLCPTTLPPFVLPCHRTRSRRTFVAHSCCLTLAPPSRAAHAPRASHLSRHTAPSRTLRSSFRSQTLHPLRLPPIPRVHAHVEVPDSVPRSLDTTTTRHLRFTTTPGGRNFYSSHTLLFSHTHTPHFSPGYNVTPPPSHILTLPPRGIRAFSLGGKGTHTFLILPGGCVGALRAQVSALRISHLARFSGSHLTCILHLTDRCAFAFYRHAPLRASCAFIHASPLCVRFARAPLRAPHAHAALRFIYANITLSSFRARSCGSAQAPLPLTPLHGRVSFRACTAHCRAFAAHTVFMQISLHTDFFAPYTPCLPAFTLPSHGLHPHFCLFLSAFHCLSSVQFRRASTLHCSLFTLPPPSGRPLTFHHTHVLSSFLTSLFHATHFLHCTIRFNIMRYE